MNLITVAISDAAAGDTAIIAAQGATTCIRIRRIVLSNGVATTQAVILKDGATALTGAMALPTSVGGLFVLEGSGSDPLFTLSQNSAFNLNLANATSVTGFVQYTLG
jgi:hypothetical protein